LRAGEGTYQTNGRNYKSAKTPRQAIPSIPLKWLISPY
jgi:hypothetical protein